jgi:O-antigen/teichoic acid export membrane protein
MVFLLLPGSMGNTVYPTISEHTTNGDTDAIRRILCRVLAFAPALAIPGTVGALVIGPQVLGLYGPEFVSCGLFLLILSVARVAESYEMILTQTLYALDYPDRAFRVAAVFITANLVLNIALGILFGAVGAAVATTISMVVSLFLGWRMLPSSVTPSFPFRTLVTQVASALVMGAILVVVTDVWPIRGDLSVVLYALFGAGLYAIGILVGSPLARDVLQQFRRELTV